MAVKVLIPSPLRPYTDGQESVVLEGATVDEVLGELTSRYARIKKHLYGEDGTLRSYVNVYVNDENIRFLRNEKTPVTERDVVSIVPSIAGGKE